MMMDLPAARRLLDWALSISDSPDDRPRAVCDVLQRVIGPTAGVSMILWDGRNDRFGRSVSTIPGQPDGYGSSHARSGRGVTAAIVREGRVVHCPSVSAAQASENPMLAKFSIESYVGAPISCGDRSIGAIYLLNRHPEEAGGEEISLLTDLARRAGESLAPAANAEGPRAPETSEHERAWPAKASVWDAIVNDPITGAALADDQGVVRMWSPTMSRHWRVEPDCPSHLDEFLSPALARTFQGLIDRCRETGETSGVSGLHEGRRQATICRLVRERSDARDRFWLRTVLTQESPDTFGSVRSLSAEESSLGALDSLTPRELEVLALLAEGMRLQEVARRLHRSRKTIDNHRYSIGMKLGAKSLPELVAIAVRSGLRFDEVNRDHAFVSGRNGAAAG